MSGQDRQQQVSTLRAIRLMVALGWARLCNRTVASISSAFGGRKRRENGAAKRQPRRNRVGFSVGLILTCLVIFGITIQVSIFLARIYYAVEEREGNALATIDAGTVLYAKLVQAEIELDSLGAEEIRAGADATKLAEISRRRSNIVSNVKQNLRAEARSRTESRQFDPDDATRIFLARGAESLRSSGPMHLRINDPLPKRKEVFFGSRRGEVLVVLGAAITLLVASALTMSLGVSNRDLGKVGWGTEWLFGFPVSATSLFVGKIGEYALFNFFGWIAFPLITLVFVSAGFGWWSGLPGLVFTLYLNLLVGSARMLIETVMRTVFGVAGRKNGQALFALVGSILFFAFYAIMASPELAAWFVRFAGWTGNELNWWNPLSLPLHATEGGMVAGMTTAACLGIGLLAMFGSAVLCGRLVSKGLSNKGDARSGKRGRSGRSLGPRGPAGKEFLLLVRDRNVTVQVLVTPVLVLGFWLSLNLEMASGILTGFRNTATAAFVAAVYVLSFACLPSLKREGGALWMLFSLPRSPSSILAGKAWFWGAVGCLYAIPVLAWGLWREGSQPTSADYGVAALVVVGVFLYSFIATAMGALSADPLSPRTNAPVDAKTAYLFMMLVALYTYGIYAPTAWTRLVQLVLCALLGYALWQRLRDAMPYFFEPVQEPPRRISLSHGLVAVYSFFVLQGIGASQVFSKISGLPPGAVLLLSYGVAGLLVFAGCILLLWKADENESVFRFPGTRTGRNRNWIAYILWVVGTAAVAIAAGIFYLEFSKSDPGLQELYKDSMPARSLIDLGDNFHWWFAGMAVVAAPLCEEFIFRGLVYRGMRRTASMPVATLGSAALFALVHPPFSVFPVYVLGVLAALAFEYTGRLMAPIMIHMAYNAAMISAQLGLW